MNIKFRLDAAKVLHAAEVAPETTLREIRRGLKEACVAVQESARSKHRFHAHTGALERAISYRVNRMRAEGVVFIDEDVAPYGKYVHEPTGIYGPRHAKYQIPKDVSKARKVLRFSKGSKFVFRRRVMHPGSRADRFLYEAADRKAECINEIFRRRTKMALEAAGLE